MVELASDGQAAIDRAKASDPDLILMDIPMPQLDGATATIEIRKGGYLKPVFAFTAFFDVVDQATRVAAKFDGVIAKPLDRSALIEAIAHALGR